MKHARFGLLTLLCGVVPVSAGCLMDPASEATDGPNDLDDLDVDAVGAVDDTEQASTGAAPAFAIATDPCELPFTPVHDYTLAVPRVMDTRADTNVLPGAGWHGNAVIQNASFAAAQVRLTAVPYQGAPSGYPQGCALVSLPAGHSVIFRPDNPGSAGTIGIPAIATGNWQGSLIIESDNPITAVGQISNTLINGPGHPQGHAAAYYQGVPTKLSSRESGHDLAYPNFKSGFNGSSTTLFVQNTKLIDRRFRAVARTNDGKAYTHTAWVDGYQSAAVRPSDFRLLHPDGSTDPLVGIPAACTGSANPGSTGAACFGSVTIADSDEETPTRWAAIAVEHPAAGAATPFQAISADHFQRSDALTDDNRSVTCPLIKNQFPAGQATSSGISIMNVSGVPATIELTIRQNPSTWYVHTFSNVPAYTSVVASPTAGTFGGFPTGAAGWASITSTQPIFAAVSEANGSISKSAYSCTSFRGEVFAPVTKFGFPNATDASARNTEVVLLNNGQPSSTLQGDYRCRLPGSSSFSLTSVLRTMQGLVPFTLQPSNLPEIQSGVLCAVKFIQPFTRSGLLGIVIETTRGLNITQRDDAMYDGILL